MSPWAHEEGSRTDAMLRRMRALRLLPVLLVLLVAPALPRAVGDDEPRLPRWKKGVREGTVVIDGKEEGFVALVPRGYTTRKTWPVVLLLHGNGGSARNFLDAVKPAAGRRPPLLISLERCDNGQDAVGYAPKYLAELKKQFSLDEENVYALGFSGGGFRLWDDVVCQEEVLPQFRGVVLVGSAKQSFDPPEKPERAPTVFLVGDPSDPNFGQHRVEAEKVLKEKGYEVVVHEHSSGHSLPRKELELVFEWIDDQVKESRKKAR
jgi:predicted esterase